MLNRLRNLFGNLDDSGPFPYHKYGMTPPYLPESRQQAQDRIGSLNTGALNHSPDPRTQAGSLPEIYAPAPEIDPNFNRPEQDPNDIEGMINRIYTPRTEFSDRYKKLIDRMPQPNKPGIGRRIAAIFAGNPEEQRNFLYSPYINEMSSWKNEMDAIKPGLDLERYENVNERTLANQTVGRMNEQRRIEEAERRNRERAEQDRANEAGRNERARMINEFNRFKQANPNHELTQDDEGNLIAFNPQTKEISYITDADGKKVKSSKLSEADKANLAFRNNMAEISQRHQNRLSEQENQGRITRENIQKREDVKTNRDKDGNITSVTTTTYDEKGNVTGVKTENTVKSSPTKPDNVTKVEMLLPDGKTRKMIPIDQVREAEQRGAKRTK